MTLKSCGFGLVLTENTRRYCKSYSLKNYRLLGAPADYFCSGFDLGQDLVKDRGGIITIISIFQRKPLEAILKSLLDGGNLISTRSLLRAGMQGGLYFRRKLRYSWNN